MKMFLLPQVDDSKNYSQAGQYIIEIIVQSLPHGTTSALNISAMKKRCYLVSCSDTCEHSSGCYLNNQVKVIVWGVLSSRTCLKWKHLHLAWRNCILLKQQFKTTQVLQYRCSSTLFTLSSVTICFTANQELLWSRLSCLLYFWY